MRQRNPNSSSPPREAGAPESLKDVRMPDSRVDPLSSNVAKVFSALAGFDEPTLDRNISVLASANSPRQGMESPDVPPMSDQVAGHITALADTSGEMFGTSIELWKALGDAAGLLKTEGTAFAQCGYRAILCDALFAHAEGERSLFSQKTDSLDQLLKRLDDIHIQRMESPRRFTPRGMPTDDSQFVLSGLLCATIYPESFGEKIIDVWRQMGKTIWRNYGRRLGLFLNGDDAALSGPVTLGDLLRFSAFSALNDPMERKEQFLSFAIKAKLSQEQISVGKAFLEMHSSLLGGDVSEAGKQLAHFVRQLKGDHGYMKLFAKAVKDNLFDEKNFIGYLKDMSRIGRDFDTFAFLGGLLMPSGGLSVRQLPPLLRPASEAVLPVAINYLLRNEQIPELIATRSSLQTSYFAAEYRCNEFLNKIRASTSATQVQSILGGERA